MREVVAAALLCTMLVVLSMIYVDRPVARFIAHHHSHFRFFQVMASPSLLSLPLACIYLASYVFAIIFARPAGRRRDLFLMVSVATVAASAVKDELKWIFGRPWPTTWVYHGIYSFHPFNDNFYYGGFPSGHTTYISAPLFVLWWRFPQLRLLWATIIACVMIGLVCANYHFVADVIAGLFLGLAAAFGTITVWPMGRER